jgi:hypothetical protein
MEPEGSLPCSQEPTSEALCNILYMDSDEIFMLHLRENKLDKGTLTT